MTTGLRDSVISKSFLAENLQNPATEKNGSWWRRRTLMERCLTLITTILIIIGISLLAALVSVLHKKNWLQQENDDRAKVAALHLSPQTYFEQGASSFNLYSDTDKKPICNDEKCNLPECIHSASRILKYMNAEEDPCNDFYNFTCGNFIATTNIPDDKTSVTSFSQIGDELQQQLYAILKEPSVDSTTTRSIQLVKKLYRACMNKTRIEDQGLTFVKETLDKLGGWPVLTPDGAWTHNTSFDWRQTVYKLRQLGFGISYFVDISIGTDFKNSTKRTIDIDQPSLGLRREFLVTGFEEKLVQAYYNFMVDIAVIFGADRGRAERELKQSLEFEISLANITLPSEKRRNASALYNPMPIEELQRRHSSIPWLTYFNTILRPEAEVHEDTIVTVSTLQYLRDFEALIAQTPKRIQANYILWRVTSSVLSYLTEEVRQRQLDYATILTGRTEREARWKECTDFATGSLSLAAGSLYIKRHFKSDARQNALEMVGDIRAQFEKMLRTVDWMDEVTRAHALDKAKAMTTHIAYPDELLDDGKLDNFYAGLEINETAYLPSILNMTLFARRFSHSRLYKPVNKTDWLSHGAPAVVNAYYASLENSIQFPAGILQGVFFNAERPRYMNYGAIGFVIGHEITHGFDDQGRQFDKDGNLVNWWAEATQKAYLEKAQCIIEQYGNYTVPKLDINLNGINTQGENIADNGGVKEAYLAYRDWVERNGRPEPTLPGLNYTPNQLFWISAANIWCSKYREESMKIRVRTGFHSPGRFRIIGSLSNLEYFAQDFNCPVGSKMNPAKKCQVW